MIARDGKHLPLTSVKTQFSLLKNFLPEKIVLENSVYHFNFQVHFNTIQNFTFSVANSITVLYRQWWNATSSKADFYSSWGKIFGWKIEQKQPSF